MMNMGPAGHDVQIYCECSINIIFCTYYYKISYYIIIIY